MRAWAAQRKAHGGNQSLAVGKRQEKEGHGLTANHTVALGMRLGPSIHHTSGCCSQKRTKSRYCRADDNMAASLDADGKSHTRVRSEDSYQLKGQNARKNYPGFAEVVPRQNANDEKHDEVYRRVAGIEFAVIR